MDKAVSRVWDSEFDLSPLRAVAASNASDLFVKQPNLIVNHDFSPYNTILDAGCGYGRVLLPLVSQYPKANFYGIDSSSKMLSLCSELLNKNQPSAKKSVQLITSDLSSVSLPSESVDCIYSVAVLLHNSYESTTQIVSEFYRLLKPGGTLIIVGSFINTFSFEGALSSLYLLTQNEKYVRHGLIRPYTKKSVEMLLHKFSDITVEKAMPTFLPRSFFGIDRLASQVSRFNRFVYSRAKPLSAFLHYDVVAKK